DAMFEEIDQARAGDVALLRVKLDHLKWALGKMSPKKYCEKHQVIDVAAGVNRATSAEKMTKREAARVILAALNEATKDD
ncbi:MAG: hypothetical protein VXW22_16055, partial [Pseudomonadota bacterium]|nr:hypothetical protein [Pseudomonadota bacterium]